MYDKSLTHNVKKTYIIAVAAIILTAATACRPDKNKHQKQQTATTAQTEQKQDGGEDSLTISFTMTDINGKEINVTDEFARHKITIVDFWASWCGPCRQEMPSLVKTYNEYKDKGLGIVGVSLDEDREQWINAVNSMGMEWTQLSDLQGWHNAAAQMYGIQAIPFTVIVDNNGHVMAAGLRGEELAAFVASRLK